MPCTRPRSAFQDADGRVSFEGPGRPLQLACGQCQFCRLQRSADWATRITHESQLHERNCFLTLTYRDDALPEGQGLSLRDWQLFAKRFRSDVGPFRYYMCGEYGEQTNRPHYHACIFGEDFSEDRELVSRNHQDDLVFRSDWLDWLWKKGGCRIGNLTTQSASYVARYCMKKATGALADQRYERVNTETGEVVRVRSDFATMSLKPGIGAGWFEKYSNDVFPEDQVVINGERRKTPRYYDKLLERRDAAQLEQIKAKRVERAEVHKEDLTPERLMVRERVLSARLGRLQRSVF